MIETNRLFIRRFEVTDYSDLYEYLSDPAIYLFEPGKPITLSEAKALAIQHSKGNDFFTVVLKQSNKMIGHIYFKHIEPKERLTWELGYIFNPAYQQQGNASEACAAITDYVNEFDINKDGEDRQMIQQWVLLGDPSMLLGGYE